MYYADTIIDPNFHGTNSTGGSIGYGDVSMPVLGFDSFAEALVAGFVLDKTEPSKNDFTRGLAETLESEADPKRVLAVEGTHLSPVVGLCATLVRRRISEAATGDDMGLPKEVIIAARHMHYGPEARPIGSTQPAKTLSHEINRHTERHDMEAAVKVIARLGAIPIKPPEKSERPTKEWKKYIRVVLTDYAPELIAA